MMTVKIDINHATKVSVKRTNYYDGDPPYFHILTFTFTSDNGSEFEVRAYSEDMNKIETEGLEVYNHYQLYVHGKEELEEYK